MVLLTAASIVVFRETDSATAVSFLLGLAAIPTVLLAPLAGSFADRYPRRRILLAADLSAAVVCVLAVAADAWLPRAVVSAAAVGALAAMGAFYRPAAQALLPSLASGAHIGRANSGLRLATSLASIAGPAVGALLVSHGGLMLVLWVDGASFLVSAALVATIAAQPRQERGPRASAMREAWAGMSYAVARRPILTVTGAVGAVMLVGTLVNAGTLPLVRGPLELSDSRYGILLGIEGAGAMALAVLFLVLGPGRRLLVTGAFALIGVGGTTLLLGAAAGFATAAVALVLQGASVVALQVAFASFLQQEAEDAFRGRVMALVGMVASIAQLAGYALAGPVIDLTGVRVAFSAAGTVILFVAVPVIVLAFSVARAERDASIATG
jgi:MFS family permease